MVKLEVKVDKLGKYLVFDERDTNLLEINQEVAKYFPGVGDDELFFEQPDYGYDDMHDLIIRKLPELGFVEDSGNTILKSPTYIIHPIHMLSQVTKHAAYFLSHHDLAPNSFEKIKFTWYNSRLSMSIDKSNPEQCDSGECGAMLAS